MQVNYHVHTMYVYTYGRCIPSGYGIRYHMVSQYGRKGTSAADASPRKQGPARDRRQGMATGARAVSQWVRRALTAYTCA